MSFERELIFAKNLMSQVFDLFETKESEKEIKYAGEKDIKLALDGLLDEYIVSKLKSTFSHGVLSEEGGAYGDIEGDDPYWIVDPLDGSMNFLNGIPLYCFSLALWQKRTPLFGLIFDPLRRELFWNDLKGGVYINEKKILLENRPLKRKEESIVATGFPSASHFGSADMYKEFIEDAKDYKKIRMLGSAALSLAWLSCGRVNAYREKRIYIWDVAAGIAINSALPGTKIYYEKSDEKKPLFDVYLFRHL